MTILERLDSRERAKIDQEAAYHEAKEEIARIARQLRANRTHVSPAFDIEAATSEVVECLTNLESFDKLPAATQKSFFGRFVDRGALHFRKESRGKRVVSVLERGLLQLLPLYSGPLFRPGYSGGGI